MCLTCYVVVMIVAFVMCAPLLLIPSKRRLGLQLCLAILASLPGVLAFQFVMAIPLGILLLCATGMHMAFSPPGPPDWVQWAIGIPIILVMFVSMAGGSLWG